MYEAITKYLSRIESIFNEHGHWIVDSANGENNEDQSKFPLMNGTNVIYECTEAFNDSDFGVHNYSEELEKLGWKFDDKIILADVESLDAKGCLIF